MHDTFEKLEGLTEHVKQYINTSVESARLQVAEKTSFVIGNMIAVAVVVLLLLFFIFFGSIAAAWALSDWIGEPYAGFLIVAGIYLLLGVIVWFARQRIIRFPVMNAIIRQLHKKDDDDETRRQ